MNPTVLQRDLFDGIISNLSGDSRGTVGHYLKSMTRIFLRSRRMMAASILLLLAGVTVLSAATRRPCLRPSTAPWHVFKAGHMTESRGPEVCGLEVIAIAQRPQAVPVESPAPPPTRYFPQEDLVPPAIPLIAQIRHFRAPPILD